ncbi:MAG: CAP domain-containing protein [Candidatus Cloacimonadaceae bacterium]|jgi:hypothetical protein|nr:CAP domain-containing protein [Candidatus Cloacimonadota bacterium]MDY0126967.1 CAP domain-containing protein [Candidatus Cloacimonadaceae bacterium]MCB5255758.1 CAP domain-containing protein [Candidatus Cloacimonadota bacterium]MCK9178602.1 CAP domain-containing protein [Candidatus Cloacimonadota bacterium]MCK9242784.1 CAP domain-containing protein [Candidatus Cloacimonadota bacterium]
MKRWFLVLFTLVLSLSVLTAKGKTMSVQDFEKEVWRLTNIERSRHSLKALAYDSGLARLARFHSQNMQKRGFFSHRDPQGYQVTERQKRYYPTLVVSNIGENIGRFRNEAGTFTPQELVSGWMASPSHKENVLHPDYTHLGVGIAIQGDTMYATQNFATPLIKMKSNPPKSLDKQKVYRLSFDYLSPNRASRLACTMLYPDPNKAFKISEDQEMVGAQPLRLDWVSKTQFNIDISFLAGKGDYQLCFGFDGGYFPEGIVLKAK